VDDVVGSLYRRGLELAGAQRWFEAHEAFEEAWRVAAPAERDFFQGLVHVVVAWHHARVTGRQLACERQLEKATRRLHPYAPVHRELDVAALLTDVETARGRFPDLATPRFRRARVRG
jgi:predicted metal-dependent hydrolase